MANANLSIRVDKETKEKAIQDIVETVTDKIF